MPCAAPDAHASPAGCASPHAFADPWRTRTGGRKGRMRWHRRRRRCGRVRLWGWGLGWGWGRSPSCRRGPVCPASFGLCPRLPHWAGWKCRPRTDPAGPWLPLVPRSAQGEVRGRAQDCGESGPNTRQPEPSPEKL
ncbi:hypothetical protein ANANG_G00175500 [Anguilla anguilla]|uniref:Uncharacterized protein n=1 Tax=Anguilla anguilla TaxID=7936 RepID=A0A9D3RTD8_ANGAN|nr:hypothetical protein ANANG_G00175500 [Anguilla anguilla]